MTTPTTHQHIDQSIVIEGSDDRDKDNTWTISYKINQNPEISNCFVFDETDIEINMIVTKLTENSIKIKAVIKERIDEDDAVKQEIVRFNKIYNEIKVASESARQELYESGVALYRVSGGHDMKRVDEGMEDLECATPCPDDIIRLTLEYHLLMDKLEKHKKTTKIITRIPKWTTEFVLDKKKSVNSIVLCGEGQLIDQNNEIEKCKSKTKTNHILTFKYIIPPMQVNYLKPELETKEHDVKFLTKTNTIAPYCKIFDELKKNTPIWLKKFDSDDYCYAHIYDIVYKNDDPDIVDKYKVLYVTGEPVSKISADKFKKRFGWVHKQTDPDVENSPFVCHPDYYFALGYKRVDIIKTMKTNQTISQFEILDPKTLTTYVVNSFEINCVRK
jgi:hypothetical protein